MPPKGAKSDKTTTKATKSDASEAENAVGKGPITVLTAREQAIMLQSILTVDGFPTVSCFSFPIAGRLVLLHGQAVGFAFLFVKVGDLLLDQRPGVANGARVRKAHALGDLLVVDLDALRRRVSVGSGGCLAFR